MRIIEGFEDAIRHLPLIHAVARVNGANDEIERLEAARVVVEAATGQDVGFNALEQPEAYTARGILRVESIDFRVLRGDVVARQATGVRVRL